MFLRRLAVCLLASLAPLSATATPERGPAFLGAGGILPSRTHAVFLLADTELSGYPVGLVGWRVGLGDLADLGLEAGGNDVALLARAHAKLLLFESEGRRWFAGLRLRVEAKRHKQTFPEGVFRPIDDVGITFVPELSFALRLGARRQHAISYSIFHYFDVDVRPGREVEHYLLPAMLGWELRLGRFQIGVDAGVFFELFRPETAGEPIFKLQALAGMRL